jgi:hypothetical protein
MDKVDKSIHEILPSQLLEMIVTQHCDMKTVGRFSTTSSNGNVPFIREFPDTVRANLLQQVFDNVIAYRKAIEQVTNDDAKIVIKRFVNVVLEYLLEVQYKKFNNLEDILFQNRAKRILEQIKTAITSINDNELMQILRAFQCDKCVPTGLLPKSELCFDIMKHSFFMTRPTWQMCIHGHKFCISFEHNIGSWIIPRENVEKVLAVKPEHFIVRTLKKNRPDDVAVEFEISKENIIYLAALMKNVHGKGVLLGNSIVPIKLNTFNQSHIPKVMREFDNTHFKSIVKI